MEKVLILGDNGHGYNTDSKRTPKFDDGTFIHEHEFNQPVCTMFLTLCKNAGYEVFDVAQGIEDIPLKTRTNLANQKAKEFLTENPNGKVIFVSFHYNAITGRWGNTEGVEVFHYPNANDGKELATYVLEELLKGTPQKSRGVKSANFHVLRETSMTAILIEAGFMDNLREAKLMLDQDFQYEVASETFKGVERYLNKIMGNNDNDDTKVEDVVDIKLGYEKIRFKNHTDVHIYRTKDVPNLVLGEVNKQEYLTDIAKKYNPKVAVNAGMFPFDGKTEQYGLVITDNGSDKDIKDYYQASSTNFVDMVAWKDGTVSIERKNGYDLNYLINIQGKAHWGVGTSYAIMINGQKSTLNWDKFSHVYGRHNRTMIGFDNKNKVWYLIVADGRTTWDKGLTGQEQYELCVQLGITDCCNLDGGGSSDMICNGKVVTGDYRVSRKIGTAFIV